MTNQRWLLAPRMSHATTGNLAGWMPGRPRQRHRVYPPTAGPASQQRVSALGAHHVIDYHDEGWPGQVRAITGGRGVAAAVDAAPAGAASRSWRLPTAGVWRPSPQTRQASSVASRCPASTSAHTATGFVSSRSSSAMGSCLFPSPPATASPMPQRRSRWQPAATPPELLSSCREPMTGGTPDRCSRATAPGWPRRTSTNSASNSGRRRGPRQP
jgi:hypothetical protein